MAILDVSEKAFDLVTCKEAKQNMRCAVFEATCTLFRLLPETKGTTANFWESTYTNSVESPDQTRGPGRYAGKWDPGGSHPAGSLKQAVKAARTHTMLTF